MKRATPQEITPIAVQSLTDRAYGELEELIVTLKLAPGAAVSEAELSSRLRIGRTPIREALQRLARERLVTILPRRGIVVSEINVARQLRLHEVRRELERSGAAFCFIEARVTDEVVKRRLRKRENQAGHL